MVNCLAAALDEIARQYTANTPIDVLQVFPKWQTELPAVLRGTVNDLRRGLEQLESTEVTSDSAVGYAFAKSALHSAIDVHDFYGSAAIEWGLPQTVPGRIVEFQQGEASLLVERLLAGAPLAVAHTFPSFDVDLRAAVRRPVFELRAACARLEAAHVDLEVRRFTESCLYPDGGAAVEAQALAFARRAMQTIVQAMSAAAVADAVSEAVAKAPPPPLPPVPHPPPPRAAARGFGLGRHFASTSTPQPVLASVGDLGVASSATLAAKIAGNAPSDVDKLREVTSTRVSPPRNCSPPPEEVPPEKQVAAMVQAAAAAAKEGAAAKARQKPPAADAAPVEASVGLGAFQFRSIEYAPTDTPGDAFNPCCERDGGQMQSLWLIGESQKKMVDGRLTPDAMELDEEIEANPLRASGSLDRLEMRTGPSGDARFMAQTGTTM